MTPTQIRDWIFQNEQEDQWWISIDGSTEASPTTISDIENRLRSAPTRSIQALHVSQSNLDNPPWIDVVNPGPPELKAREIAPAARNSATSNEKLEKHWIIIIWCSLLLPFAGSWIIVILSSVMYYVWKGKNPKKANRINYHGWGAFLVGHIIWFIVWYQWYMING